MADDVVQSIMEKMVKDKVHEEYRKDPSAFINRISNPELPRIRTSGKHKTSTQRLDARQRMLRALQLRSAGYQFDEIAKHLGYAGRQQAYKAVKVILDETMRVPADELRAQETHKLDDLINTLWIDCLLGDLKAMDRIIKLLERKAKLLGLDAPVKVENMGLPPVVRIENAAKKGNSK